MYPVCRQILVFSGVRAKMAPMEPVLIEMAEGGWMAMTGSGAPVPVAVFGRTKREAGDLLVSAIAEREELHAIAT
jgi:hypothetical protein